MTDQTNAELIAEFRSEGNEWSGKYGRMFFEAADAVEAAEQRAAEAELERDNWKMSAEEAVRAEKRWEQRVRIAEQRAEAWKRLCESTETAMTEVIEERDSAIASYKDYMALRRKAAELSAVIEKARAVIECESGWFRYRAGRVLDILATSPADALREVKAAAWAGGYNAGYSDRSTPGEPFTRNPYREEKS